MNLKISSALLCFALFFWQQIAYCADTATAFGIPIGEDFQLPECAKDAYGYARDTAVVCYRRKSTLGGNTVGKPINEALILLFPSTDKPSIMKTATLFGQVLDGRLEGISFSTAGLDSADSVFQALKTKYGEPSKVTPFTAKNLVGAEFSAIVAEWNVNGIEVKFDSVASTLDTGRVAIGTTKGISFMRKKVEEAAKGKRPL